MLSSSPRLRGAAVALLVALAGCPGPDRLAMLRTAGLAAVPGPASWTRVQSTDGYAFEVPGLPLAEREAWRFAGEDIERTFVDLDIERGLGGYLLYAYVATAPSERERPRGAGERPITGAGSIVAPAREVVMLGGRAVQVVVEGVGRYRAQHVVVRSLVLGDMVFVLAVISPAVGTIPAYAERFFDSLVVTRPLPAEPAAPEPPDSYPDEHPENRTSVAGSLGPDQARRARVASFLGVRLLDAAGFG